MKGKMKEIDWIAYVLVTLGALNWGLIGAFRIDLLQTTLGTNPGLVQLVYILIGLSGLYWVYQMMSMKK